MTQRKLLPAGVALYYVAHKLASYNPGHKPRSYNPAKLWPRCRGRPVGPGSCSRPLERGRRQSCSITLARGRSCLVEREAVARELLSVPAVWHEARIEAWWS